MIKALKRHFKPSLSALLNKFYSTHYSIAHIQACISVAKYIEDLQVAAQKADITNIKTIINFTWKHIDLQLHESFPEPLKATFLDEFTREALRYQSI
jgi:secreted Zn-dependent insulinase-like peptidase